MTERTVTEQQVIDAFNKNSHLLAPQYQIIFDELFPELPKSGELIQCFNNNTSNKVWRAFCHFAPCFEVVVKDSNGSQFVYDNYRRQTPAERGES